MKRYQMINQGDKAGSCKRGATGTGINQQCTRDNNAPAANSSHQCGHNNEHEIRPLKRARRSSCSPGLKPDTAVTDTDTGIAPAPGVSTTPVQRLKETARFLSTQQKYGEARDVLEKVLPLQDGQALMQTLTELGNLCRDLGDFDASFNYHNLALNMYLNKSSTTSTAEEQDTPCLAALAIANLRHIAAIYLQFRHCNEALLCYNFIYKIQHEPEVVAPLREVASTISCIALMHYLMEHFPEALRFYQEELRLRIELHNGNMEQEDVAIALNSIGIVYFQLEDIARAQQSFQSCLQIRQCLLGDGCTTDHECPTTSNDPHCCCYDLAMVYFNLAAIAMKQGDDDQASRLYRRSMELKKAVFGLCHPEIAVDYQYLGQLFLDNGDSKSAIEYYFEAYKVVEKLGSSDISSPSVGSNNSDTNPQQTQSAAQQLLVIIGNIHLLNGNVEGMMHSFLEAARLDTGTNIMENVGVFGDHLYSISRMHIPCAPQA